MKVLIVEDESGVAQNLKDILFELEPDIEILDILESVEEVVAWVGKNNETDLGFFDIRLADGTSFEIFEKINIDFPVIFTTAYDEFALKAFKVNSVDYLLKPLDKKAIRFAIDKYKSLYKNSWKYDSEYLLKVIEGLKVEREKKYKKSFLVHFRDQIKPVSSNDIAYFYLENEMISCVTFNKNLFHMDQSLDSIMQQLNPNDFFRANRRFIVARRSIKSAIIYSYRKLKLELLPKNKLDVLISKSKTSNFKKWLEG